MTDFVWVLLWLCCLAEGLSDQEARERLSKYGPNTLTAEKKEPLWKEFIEELREPMVLMLLVTGFLYAIWRRAGSLSASSQQGIGVVN